MRPDQETPIMELEALAIYVGVSLFKNLVNDARLVVFTDNQSAQASVVKCKSNNYNVDLIIRGICSLEERLNTVCWIERVPSYSNPADALSREEILAYKGANRSRIDPLQAWERCREEIAPSLISGGRREAVCDLWTPASKERVCARWTACETCCFGAIWSQENKMQLKHVWWNIIFRRMMASAMCIARPKHVRYMSRSDCSEYVQFCSSESTSIHFSSQPTAFSPTLFHAVLALAFCCQVTTPWSQVIPSQARACHMTCLPACWFFWL